MPLAEKYLRVIMKNDINIEEKIIDTVRELSKTLRFFDRTSQSNTGVTLNQCYMLDLIRENKIMPLSDLHERLGIDKSTTTRLIEPLLKRGLLEKMKAEHDKRASYVVITKVGEEVYENARTRSFKSISKVLEQIPANKHLQVVESIDMLLDAFNVIYKRPVAVSA
jgi:DNA-binding MarR family transcriptional regulator